MVAFFYEKTGLSLPKRQPLNLTLLKKFSPLLFTLNTIYNLLKNLCRFLCSDNFLLTNFLTLKYSAAIK